MLLQVGYALVFKKDKPTAILLKCEVFQAREAQNHRVVLHINWKKFTCQLEGRRKA